MSFERAQPIWLSFGKIAISKLKDWFGQRINQCAYFRIYLLHNPNIQEPANSEANITFCRNKDDYNRRVMYQSQMHGNTCL